MIHQFDNQFATPTRYLDAEEFDDRTRSKEIDRMAKDLGVKKKEITKHGYDKYITYDREYFKIAFREVSSDTNERTLIATLLPKNVGFGHTLFAEIPKYYELQNTKIKTVENCTNRKLFLLAVFNSIVVDFIVRLNVSIHVSKTYLMRLPMPQPSSKELKASEDYQTLIINALKLTLFHNYDDFEELAQKYHLTKQDISSTQKQVDKLKVQNDIIIAKLYNITPKELEHILSTFKVYQNKNPALATLLLSEYKNSF